MAGDQIVQSSADAVDIGGFGDGSVAAGTGGDRRLGRPPGSTKSLSPCMGGRLRRLRRPLGLQNFGGRQFPLAGGLRSRRSVLGAGILFRGRKTRCGRPGQCIAVNDERGIEINEAEIPFWGDHEVAGLDVAVDDGRGLFMEIGHHLAQLAGPAVGQFLVGGTVVAHKLGHVLPGDQVHDRVYVAVAALDHVVDAGQIAVLDAFEDIRLGPLVHPAQIFGLDPLDDHIHPQAAAIGAEQGAHTALAQRTDVKVFGTQLFLDFVRHGCFSSFLLAAGP